MALCQRRAHNGPLASSFAPISPSLPTYFLSAWLPFNGRVRAEGRHPFPSRTRDADGSGVRRHDGHRGGGIMGMRGRGAGTRSRHGRARTHGSHTQIINLPSNWKVKAGLADAHLAAVETAGRGTSDASAQWTSPSSPRRAAPAASGHPRPGLSPSGSPGAYHVRNEDLLPSDCLQRRLMTRDPTGER
jgi:hypothetical protein